MLSLILFAFYTERSEKFGLRVLLHVMCSLCANKYMCLSLQCLVDLPPHMRRLSSMDLFSKNLTTFVLTSAF